MTQRQALQFDWYDACDDPIADFLGLNAVEMNDGSACWEAVAICLGTKAVVIEIDLETDQVVVTYRESPRGDGWRSIASFAFAIGQFLGWSWVGTNCQGYQDSLSVAFGKVVPEALEPRCMFIAAGSTISCLDMVARPCS